MFQIANLDYVFLFLIIPLIYYWRRFLSKSSHRYISHSQVEMFFIEGGNKGIKNFLLSSLPFLKYLSLFLIIVALCRPQIKNSYSVEKQRGVDILIALDVSGSMASLDFKPNSRLELAKKVIVDFISQRPKDRIGLVTFAGIAYTVCPLTIDFSLLINKLKSVALGELEDGTAIGMALATAVSRIKNSKAKSKVIILLTDGVNNRGEIAPLDAAKMANDLGIRVYTVGVGKRGQAAFPVVDRFRRKTYIMVDVEIDEEVLKKIANSSGGLYFRAEEHGSLEKIFAKINSLEKTEIEVYNYSSIKEIYHYFLIAAFIILLFVEVSKRSFLRILP